MKKHWNDGTANFWEGCTKISPGCEHCKGAARDERHRDGAHWGEGSPRSALKSGFALANSMNRAAFARRFRLNLKTGERKIWKAKEMENTGLMSRPVRPQLHVMQLGDFWDPETPTEQRMLALETMMACTGVDFLISTKRPDQVRLLLWEASLMAGDMGRLELVDWITDWLAGDPPANVFLGVTIELQDQTKRFETLRSEIESNQRFVLMKPLLGPITIPAEWSGAVDLLVVAGSTGPESSPLHPDWIQQLSSEAGLYGIPFHFEAWGDWLPEKIEQPPLSLQKRDTLHLISPAGSVSAVTDPSPEFSELTWRHLRKEPQRLLLDGQTADARIESKGGDE